MSQENISRGMDPRLKVVLILAMAALVMGLTGESAGAEEAANDYHDVNYDEGFEVKYDPEDPKVTVKAEVGEVQKDYKLGPETTGKVTASVKNEETGVSVEVEVRASNEETSATVRVKKDL